MDWTELCAIGDHAGFLSLRRDFDLLQTKIHDMLERKDHGQNIVAQERDKVMGYLALETENVRKETLALSRQLYDEEYGPLTFTAVAESADPKLRVLRMQLSALVDRCVHVCMRACVCACACVRVLRTQLSGRWNHVQEAEHAMQLSSSSNKLLLKMERDCHAFTG
jgi:hypothetical protein